VLTEKLAAEPDTAPPRSNAVLIWAAIGVAFLALQVYVFAAWILSGDATPIGPGDDPVPWAHRAWAVGAQIVLSLSAIVIVAWIVRRAIRERRLTFDALLLIGWASIFWGNPLENYTSVMRLASGAMVNLGTWVHHVPGAVSPTADRVPEPLVYMVALYFGYGVLTTFAMSALMRWANRRWPVLSGVRLFLVAWLVLFLVEIVVEGLWIRTEIMAYPGGIHAISIFAGERYQIPLHIPALVALTLMAFAWLHYSRRARDAVLERGIERVPRRRRTAVRILAMVGFANVVMLLYAVPAQLLAIHSGEYPRDYPSYLNNGVCGGDGNFPCPGPETPVFKEGNEP